jgi:hypothetical protein
MFIERMRSKKILLAPEERNGATRRFIVGKTLRSAGARVVWFVAGYKHLAPLEPGFGCNIHRERHLFIFRTNPSVEQPSEKVSITLLALGSTKPLMRTCTGCVTYPGLRCFILGTRLG